MSATIMWIGQAGFILKTEKGALSVDPFCGEAKGNSERIYPPFIKKGSVHVDLVLTTHAHWDHFDPVTYEEYVIPDTIVGPGTCMAALEKSGLAIPGVRLDRGETLERCGFRITATTADHDVDSVGYWFPVMASSSISAETRFLQQKPLCQMSVWRRMWRLSVSMESLAI